MTLDKKITDLLEDQIPDYVQEYYPLFVIFITKYYQWLEQGGNPQEIVQNIQLNADIDTTASSLATKFVNTYAPNLPQTSALDRAVLVKNFRDFYRSKGSPKSFEFFFRAFFDDEINIFLPGDSLFRTSDGDWYVEKTLHVQAVTGDPKQLEHTTVRGSSSNATAIIEHAVNNFGYWDLTVQNRSLTGTFLSSETIVGAVWNFDTEVSSQIVVLNTQPVLIAAGRQRGTRSQLSADQRIQDSVYWQNFSYVIRTRITRDRWFNAVLEQLHPSGRNIFTDVTVDIDTSVSVAIGADLTAFAQTNQITTEINFANSDDFIIQPGYSFDRLANFRTGTSLTTSAGAVTYAADYTYGGENITFALQNAADNIRSYVETFSYTSITGTVSAAATTGNTAINRDSVSYTIPVTSITGTISGLAQPTGGEMVVTGSGTLFTTELPLNNIWRYYTGTVDAFNNPIYAYYSSVLTISSLPISGTVTLAAQTPSAPNYYYYASGAGTAFLSDLLVTGGDTSSGVSNETNQPIIFPGQAQPQVIINAIPMTGDVLFTSGSTSITDVQFGKFNSQLYAGGNVTITKQLSGRLTQVSSLPAVASSTSISYDNVRPAGTSSILVPFSGYHTLYGSSLTNVSSTASSRQQESSLATTTDPAMWGRWDLDIPFPVYILGTSVSRIYVHSTGMIGFASSVAAHGTALTDGAGPSSFQPAIAKLYVNPYHGGKLKNVYYQTFGVTPNRTYHVYYDGWYDYPYEKTYTVYLYGQGGVSGAELPNVLTTGVGLTLSTTPTSGTLTNGYWQVSLPWSFTLFTTSYNQIYISHHGRISFGDWVDGSGNTMTTNVTTSNGLTFGIPRLPRLEPMYVADSTAAGTGAPAPYQIVQNNPRTGNRIYFGVSSGSAATTSRVFTIRWEGGFYASTDRFYAWEVDFTEGPTETERRSVTIHGATSTYYSQFVWPAVNFIGIPLWKVGLDGQPTTEVLTQTLAPYVSSGGVYAQNQYVTSLAVTANFNSANLTKYTGSKQVWEAIFAENSSSGITVLIPGNYTNYSPNSFYGANTTPALGSNFYVSSPRIRPLVSTDYVYVTNSTPEALAFLSLSQGMALGRNGANANQGLQWYQTPLAAVSGIVSTYSLSSSTSMLFRISNVRSNAAVALTKYTLKSLNWSSVGATLTSVLSAMTSEGIVARWPQDGYLATAGTPNPEPTCSGFAVVTATARPGVDPVTQIPGYSGTSVLVTSTTTVQGYLLSYGSSSATHGRWIMTTPTFGTLHTILVNGFVNASSASYTIGLAPPATNQNLELWYSTSENPTPPAAGQTPTTAGWTKVTNIWTGGSSPSTIQGGTMFFQKTGWGSSKTSLATFNASSIGGVGNGTGGGSGFYAVGKTGNYTRTPGQFYNKGPVNFLNPFKLTWLIYQTGYTAQSTPNQRTSEYLITELTTQGYPHGFAAQDYYITNTASVTPYAPSSYSTTNPPATEIPYYSLPNLRNEIGSGSVVRISHPSDRAGNTVAVDYIVTQNPRLLGDTGDYTLALRTTTNIANTSFTNLYDSATPGGYFKGVAEVVGSIVETRTIAAITSNSSAVVSVPFTSSSIQFQGNYASAVSVGARSFSLIAVNNNTSLTLASASNLESAAAITALVSGLTVTADRRFVLTGINTSSNLTVSGGGVYANFTGKTATFARYENSRTSGFLISGYHDASLLTATTTWITNGIPGIDNLGINKGNVAGTRLVIGGSSYTLVSVLSDTAILVTGTLITNNFYDTGLTMYFPSYSSNISVTGISTLFLPQITTGTATSAGVTIEEVTESGRTPDFRYGFLQIGNTSFAITSIINDTSLTVAGGPITESFAATSAISYRYRRDYPLPRAIAPPTSASFDKIGSTIGVDDSLITQGNNVDFTNFRTLYHNSSYALTLTANTVVLSTSLSVTAGSSLVLLVTWMKDFADNATEGNNRFTVSVSSAGTFLVSFDNEIQQNYKDVAIGQTLLYSNTFYVHSSNTISSTNVVNSGATTSQVVWTWIPFNINRSGVYSRLSARFDSRADSSINISVSVPASYQWNSTSSDFVNITVLGAA